MSHTPTPKRMSWGDMSRPRVTTAAYRAGMTSIFGDKDKERTEKQSKLATDARLAKAKTMLKVYGEDAPEWAKELATRTTCRMSCRRGCLGGCK
jgi:hypothetical protein